jgi:hypothetical protein
VDFEGPDVGKVNPYGAIPERITRTRNDEREKNPRKQPKKQEPEDKIELSEAEKLAEEFELSGSVESVEDGEQGLDISV